jgi:hypothetical protein
MHLPLPLLAAAALVAATPAHADTLLAAEPGARHLAAAGGYMAWSVPDGERWRLRVRAPDGTVSTPRIPSFRRPARPAIGSTSYDFERRLLLVYARRGDVYRYDLRSGGRQRRVRSVSSRVYRESAPSVNLGHWTFVRRSGARPGLYHASPSQPAHRIAHALPREAVNNASRVAYPWRGNVIVRRLSGKGRTYFFEGPGARSVGLTRYRVAWLSGDDVFQTTRLAGSGGPHDPEVREGARPLAGVRSIAFGGGQIAYYLDAEGVKTVEPRLF